MWFVNRIIPSFFSLLEFLLDAFFAFERPGLGFLEFRRLPWREGFKMVIALPPSSDILRIYEQIVRIRDDFRNPLIHGFNNESGLLLSVPFGGLVPASFEHLDNAIRFGLDSPFPPSSVGEIVSSFAALFDLLKKIEPYTYYVRYLEYDFAVPMLKSEIAAIRSEMTSPEDFEHYLRLKSEYQYAILNREL